MKQGIKTFLYLFFVMASSIFVIYYSWNNLLYLKIVAVYYCSLCILLLLYSKGIIITLEGIIVDLLSGKYTSEEMDELFSELKGRYKNKK